MWRAFLRAVFALPLAGEGLGALGAVAFGFLDGILVEIESHHLVVPLHEPRDHVAPQ
jgi:hypothetical protein